jgi:aspartate kinase
VTVRAAGDRAAGDGHQCALLAGLADPDPHRQRPWRGAHLEIDGADIIKRMGEGQVAVIAGFQGLGPDNRIATLGRGGSDTSAVAIAAAVKADRCDIYTDVDGVYTTDPRIVPKARG